MGSLAIDFCYTTYLPAETQNPNTNGGKREYLGHNNEIHEFLFSKILRLDSVISDSSYI
jgi:hypothetical protein